MFSKYMQKTITFFLVILLSACGKTENKIETVEEIIPLPVIEVDTATSYEYEATKLSEPRNETDTVNITNDGERTIFTGRRINISVTGLDGRIGYLSNIADANHIISILIDAGKIEITSIPRDTYCDLGYEIKNGYDKNKLTYCLSMHGRERYHKELAQIAKLDTIHYYVEFGFSQAIGIIEFFGYKESTNTLQVLRNRTALGGDDFQRCYTQGQFMRQTIINQFNKFTGISGNILVRAGLLLAETNLTGDVAVEIIKKLEKIDFPKTQESVMVRVCPPKKIHYREDDFSNEETILQLVNKIEDYNKTRFKKGKKKPQTIINVSKKLNEVLLSAAADTNNYPTRTISKLQPYFKQRAWYQVKDKNERAKIRDEFGLLLSTTYKKLNKNDEATKVLNIIEADRKIFENK